jgi:hypothetical protein
MIFDQAMTTLVYCSLLGDVAFEKPGLQGLLNKHVKPSVFS